MKRTPLKERKLPDYTLQEEQANMITHIVGGSIGIIIAFIAVITAVVHKNVYGTVSAGIYGLTLISLFAVSSVYHGLRHITAKKVMQVIDHCTIYFLIAGTYTPILLSSIRVLHPVIAWTVFGIEWGIALTAATLTAIDLNKYKTLSMICYICMGWFIVLLVKITVSSITPIGFLWLLIGGIAYTVGAVLYAIGHVKKFYHTVFHIFVDIGSILQAICIICFVL